MINHVIKNHAQNEAARLVSELFLFFKKLVWDKSRRYEAQLKCIWIALNLPYNKNKLYKTLDY